MILSVCGRGFFPERGKKSIRNIKAAVSGTQVKALFAASVKVASPAGQKAELFREPGEIRSVRGLITGVVDFDPRKAVSAERGEQFTQLIIAHLVLKRVGQNRDCPVLQEKAYTVLRRYFLPRNEEGTVVADQFAECFIYRRNEALFQHILRKMGAGDDGIGKE